MKRVLFLALSLSLLLTACGFPMQTLYYSNTQLASFTENCVTVEINLVSDQDQVAWLEAVFTPEEDYHLYSKDIPREGVDGLGRPTLLELVPGSLLESTGDLEASLEAVEDADCPGLFCYPEGPVTLRQPVALPVGEGWHDEQVSITYMACKEGRCSPPVVGKLVSVRVPGMQELVTP
jgi:hypothetical protein